MSMDSMSDAERIEEAIDSVATQLALLKSELNELKELIRYVINVYINT